LCFKLISVGESHLRNHLQRESTCLVPCAIVGGILVIFNQNLALNSHLQAQHENLNHHYITLDVLSNAEGLPLQEMTSTGVVGSGPFWSTGSHMAKNVCHQVS
jgi:hypothetical protein